MTITNKELFINAFLEAEQITNKNYLNKDDFNFDFSDEFNKKMKKLIAKESRISFNHRKRISRALIAAIIATIIMFTGLMSVSASRQKIIEFIETIFPKYTQVELSEESAPTPDTIETAYTLGYVPDGYELEQYNQDEVSVFIEWENNDNSKIVFSQDILNGDFMFDNEHIYEKTTINNYDAYILGDENNMIIHYTDGNYLFTVKISSSDKNEFKNELINIAKSIKTKN